MIHKVCLYAHNEDPILQFCLTNNSNRDRSYPEPGRPAEGEYEADTQDREMSN